MRVLFDISSACPARCRYCLHQSLGLASNRFVSLDNARAILDILSKENFRYVYLYMSGEPTCHPQFIDLVKLLPPRGITGNVATKLTVPIPWGLLKGMPIVLDVTVDSLQQESQHHIAPGIRTEVVLRNLAELKGILPMTVTTVVNRYNEDELPSLADYFRKRGIPWRAKPMGYYMGSHITQEAVKQAEDLLPRNPRYAARFKIENGKVISRVERCPFGDPAISADGSVTVCCHDMLFEIETGNMLKAGSLLRVLNGGLYRKFRKLGNERKLSICRGCN